jgi:RNA polymerase sigma-70 factor (ECF subfamily)
VRLCAGLTVDAEVAEDLVQETLIRAWEHHRRLRDPARRQQWLAGIARNVCRQWLRQQRRDRAHRAVLGSYDCSDPRDMIPEPADAFDLEVELERGELAALLDRALALLPPLTRAVLIDRYVQALPQDEIARRLGTSEGAVEARLQRGKLSLRRLLTSDLRHEAAAYGLTDAAIDGWQETRIWCPLCARRRLIGRFAPDSRRLTLRCQACCTAPGMTICDDGNPVLFDGVRGYRAAFSRVLGSCHRVLVHGLDQKAGACRTCGGRMPLELGRYVDEPIRGLYWLRGRCTTCGRDLDTGLGTLALCLPEGRRFWRDHPRMLILPERPVEADGHQAIVTRLQDTAGSARLDVVISLDTFAVLGIHGTGAD